MELYKVKKNLVFVLGVTGQNLNQEIECLSPWYLVPEGTNPGHQTARFTKFYTVVPNIVVSLV
jgi:hypothetical protein